MTVSDPRHPQVLDRPACTPSAIRAVLAANADSELLARRNLVTPRVYGIPGDHEAGYNRAHLTGNTGYLISVLEMR
jgi:hypothetical protein